MKCVLFDMDGVLVDSEPAYLLRLQRHMCHYGIRCAEEELQAFVGVTSLSAARTLVETYHLSLTAEEFWEEENRLYGNLYLDSPELSLFDGVKELLTLLAERKIKVGLVSSTSAKGILSVLDRFGLARYFDVIISREMVEHHKPSPEPYEKAARFLAAEAEDCVVVEDSPIGIAAGKAAGMTVVGVKASNMGQDTSGADMEVQNHEQVREALESLGWL